MWVIHKPAWRREWNVVRLQQLNEDDQDVGSTFNIHQRFPSTSCSYQFVDLVVIIVTRVDKTIHRTWEAACHLQSTVDDGGIVGCGHQQSRLLKMFAGQRAVVNGLLNRFHGVLTACRGFPQLQAKTIDDAL